MKRSGLFFFILFLAISLIVPLTHVNAAPADQYGQLKIVGNQLCDKNGQAIQLKGMSSHGIQWFPQFVNIDSMRYLRDNWGLNVFRVAMYTAEGGYISNSTTMKAKVGEAVQAAINLGIYVIVDWHILSDGDPNTYKTQSKAFFQQIATQYGNYPNIIYEICNEPNGNVTWAGQIKPYAQEICQAIRAIDPDNIIIVGSSTWSQDVNQPADSPLAFSNVAYTCHFYAGTHTQWLRDRIDYALNKGIAIFVTEWGTSDASGNGGPYLTEAKAWTDFMAARKISWCNWSLCDKSETSAALLPGASPTGGWTNANLSASGQFVKSQMGGGTGIPPTVNITNPTSGTHFTAPANIAIAATASDSDGSVSKVEFYNGTTLLPGGTITSPPYNYTWNNVPQGTYTIQVIATDNSGLTSSKSVSVIVDGTGNQFPTVSITSPTNGQNFTSPANITIQANASDSDGTISRVEFYNGSTLLGTDTSAPYSFTWNNVQSGSYTITARATDNANATTASSPISFTVGGNTGAMKVQFFNATRSTTSNTLYLRFKLVNTGNTSINLTNVKMRYYYTIDGEKAQNFWCDWSTVGSSNVTGQFVKLSPTRTNADYYVEIGFRTGTLAAGQSIEVQGRVAKSDWTNYTQTNDYSYNSSASNYVDWSRVTGYLSGAPVWGTAP